MDRLILLTTLFTMRLATVKYKFGHSFFPIFPIQPQHILISPPETVPNFPAMSTNFICPVNRFKLAVNYTDRLIALLIVLHSLNRPRPKSRDSPYIRPIQHRSKYVEKINVIVHKNTVGLVVCEIFFCIMTVRYC